MRSDKAHTHKPYKVLVYHERRLYGAGGSQHDEDHYSGHAEINGGNMKLIYVASPYAGDIERNTEFAKKACWFVMNEGHAFFAPHLLYPQVLNEHDSDDRDKVE